MANVAELWRGAVEPAEVGASGNEVQAYRGAVEPAATDTVDALLANDLESASEVSAPSMSSVGENALLADDVESASSVSTPVLDAATASNVIALWRGAIEPAESGGSGNEIQAWRGAVEPAATDTVDALLADDLESASQVSAPTLDSTAGEDVLLADDIESASQTSTPAITQTHALLSVSVQSTSSVSVPSLNGGLIRKLVSLGGIFDITIDLSGA